MKISRHIQRPRSSLNSTIWRKLSANRVLKKLRTYKTNFRHPVNHSYRITFVTVLEQACKIMNGTKSNYTYSAVNNRGCRKTVSKIRQGFAGKSVTILFVLDFWVLLNDTVENLPITISIYFVTFLQNSFSKNLWSHFNHC